MINKPRFKSAFAGIILLFLITSCAKDKVDGPESGSNLSGKVMYSLAGTVYELDMQSMNRSVFFSYNIYSFSNWHMSMDGKYLLTSEEEPGDYVNTIFKLINSENEQIVKQFKYRPPAGNGTGYSGQLSPNHQNILIQPDLDNGAVVLDTDGNLVIHLQGINGEPIELGDQAIWMPDNSILLTFQDKYIFRSAPPYTSLTLVKEMSQQSWGGLRVNNSGTKLSLYIGEHMYTMDVNGNNLVQVTESDATENMAAFSPDDKYLLIGANYVHAPITGSTWLLKVIPNDGKKYNLDNDPAVISLKPANDNLTAKSSGRTLWLP